MAMDRSDNVFIVGDCIDNFILSCMCPVSAEEGNFRPASSSRPISESR